MSRFNKVKDEIKVLRLIWRSAKGQHLRLSVAMIMELLIGMFPPTAIYILQKTVGIKVSNLESLLTRENVILILVVYFVYLVLGKLSRIMTSYSVTEVEYSLRSQFVVSLKAMSFSDVINKIGLQSSNGLTQEISMASSLIPMVYRSFIRATITILGFCVLSFIISPYLFVVVISLTVAVLLSIMTLRKKVKRIHQELYTRISSLYQLFAEWLDGYRMFRVYNSMEFAVNRMQEVFLSIRHISRSLTVIANSQSILAEMITYSVAAAIIVMMPTENGVIHIGILISYPAAILFIRDESMVLINGYQQLANTESSIKRLYQILSNKPSNEERVPCMANVQQICFDGVSYSYQPETDGKQILRQARLVLEKGRLNVITGSSGTGKSTTLNLLLGLLHVQEGTVKIVADKKSADEGRHGIALVEQEPFFFDGTLYDNICMGREGISTTDIIIYLQALHLDNLFPSIESLTEKNEKFRRCLSSGEKQRLALIRALVGNPSVLVVDEVTSNIDVPTASLIIDYLHQLARQVLVVVVSHDPSFIAKADVAYQLEYKQFTNIK